MTRLSLLVDLASVLAREVDLDQLLRDVADTLAVALGAERASVWLIDAEAGDLVTRVAVLPEVERLRQPLGRGVVGHVAARGAALRIDDAATDPRFDPSADERTGFRTRNILAVPIREAQGAPVRGVVQVLNRAAGSFDVEDERYLVAFGLQLGRALALTTLRADDASGPGLSLRGPFNRIVGRGPAMDAVYARILLAAGTDATVLLRGETGTGKTLLARAIHVNSPRSEGPFVTVDCTTLPRELVESELFGHERGAFTGADRRVTGRVERADGGTLFLDEVGDLPPEAQGKLLRFLQDRAFERVGGREELRSDCRVLCATHHDLERLVEEGRFRRDLYYRVRVVEVQVPSLRAATRRSSGSRATSRPSTPGATGGPSLASTTRRSRRSSRTRGPATCESWSTGSRARSCWPRTARSARARSPRRVLRARPPPPPRPRWRPRRRAAACACRTG
ncbi:MAG: sigma 54-interacting transcriptional regulator [Sandaracinaceae bacterium]